MNLIKMFITNTQLHTGNFGFLTWEGSLSKHNRIKNVQPNCQSSVILKRTVYPSINPQCYTVAHFSLYLTNLDLTEILCIHNWKLEEYKYIRKKKEKEKEEQRPVIGSLDSQTAQ